MFPSHPINWFAVTAVVREQVRKEFPNIRQDEKRISFTRVGDAVRTVSWLKEEPNPFTG